MIRSIRQARWIFILLLTINLLALIVTSVSARKIEPEEPNTYQDPTDLQRLMADTNGAAEVSLNLATGVASFIRFPAGEELDIAGDPAIAGSADPTGTGDGTISSLEYRSKAAAFFNSYGGIFGISNFSQELALVDEKTDAVGYTHLTYHQVYQGLEVFAGQLRVHFNQAGRISAVNGTFIPDLSLDTTPSLSLPIAKTMAVNFVKAKNELATISTEVYADETELILFRQGLVQGVPGSNHLAYEVLVVDNAGNIREYVYVDAHRGVVLDHYTGIPDGLSRKVYERSISPSNLKWEEGDSFPTGDVDWNNELLGAEETYNLFMSMAGRDSFDGNGSDMLTVNDPTGWFCMFLPNASWNSISTNYCPGVTGDDTVAHEWGHAYTEYTHNLVYAWQSGALNESFSDIWGEVVDFLNSRGTDTPIGLRSAGGNACSVYGSGSPSTDNTYRWLSGEDDPAFGGAIRDMWRPACYGDPGKVSASQYVCSTTDNGGVHSNSGVPNRAFALLVDGDTSLSINSLGLTKSAHIYWQAAAGYQSAATDFVEHAAALRAACSDLVGVNLPALSTSNPNPGLSGVMISSADCSELDKVITALEFETAPSCTFQPLLDPSTLALCDQGTVVNPIHLETWLTDTLPASWSAGTRNAVAGFDVPQWAVAGNLPDNRPGYAAFGADPNTSCILDDTGVNYLDSPPISIPTDVNAPRLAFDHWVATEEGYDGGNVKISINSGPFNLIPASAFTFNAYNSNLLPSAQSSNPMAGETSFNGSEGGTNSGSWVQSLIDLSALVGPDDSFILRFEMGTDVCSGKVGWYIDNLQTYSCELPGPPAITHTPVISATVGNALPITATITTSSPPLTATLFYSSSSDIIYSPLSMSNTSGDVYEATISGPEVEYPTLAYYIEATDTVSSVVDGPYLVNVIQPPPIPSLISPVGAITDDTPTYIWNETAEATDYQLYVIDDLVNEVISNWYPSASVCSGGTCMVTPTELLTPTGYTWYIKAANPAGGTWSPGLGFNYFTDAPPAADLLDPVGVIATQTPTYTWNEVGAATDYKLYIIDDQSTELFSVWYPALNICAAGTCQVTNTITLTTGNFTWFVKSANLYGSVWSQGMDITFFDGPKPPAPVLISPMNVTADDTPPYTWNEVTNALEYKLYLIDSQYSQVYSSLYLAADICAAGTCMVTPTTVLSIGNYIWYVKARNPGGGSWSAGAYFSYFTAPAPPPPFFQNSYVVSDHHHLMPVKTTVVASGEAAAVLICHVFPLIFGVYT